MAGGPPAAPPPGPGFGRVGPVTREGLRGGLRLRARARPPHHGRAAEGPADPDPSLAPGRAAAAAV
eukprot:3299798-Alexandrium_andersonii.AAC.1